MKRIIITISTCDNKYLDILKAFLMSLKMNAGHDYPLRAILVNGNETIFSGLKRIYPLLEIEPVEMPRLDWTQNKYLVWLIRLRPEQMLKTLYEDWDQILSLDSDTLVIKTLDRIWDDVIPGSIKIWERRKQNPQGGVYILGNSDATKRFYKDYTDGLGKGFALKEGQKALCYAYEKHKNIKHVPLDNKYNDEFSKCSSTIWHCKHGNMKTNKRYLKIMCHYYGLAQELYNKE